MESDSSSLDDNFSETFDDPNDPTYNPNCDSHLLNNSDTPIDISDDSIVSPNIILDQNQKIESSFLLNQTDNEAINLKMEKIKELNSLLQLVDKLSGKSENIKLELDKFCNSVDLIHSQISADKASVKLFLNLLKSKLYDSAYEVVRYKEFESWKDLKIALKKKFIIRRSQGVINSELINARQTQNMDIRAFACKIQALLDELNETCIDKQGIEAGDIITKLNESTAQCCDWYSIRHK